MNNQKTFKLCGDEFDFRLEISGYGFTLWVDKKDKQSVWLLDASTIANDGSFRVGVEKDTYGFSVHMEKPEFSNKFEFTLSKLGDAHEQTSEMGLEVNSGQE